MSKGSYTLESKVNGLFYNALGLLFMVHVYATFCAIIAVAGSLLGGIKSKSYRIVAGSTCLILPVAAVTSGFIAAQSFDVTRTSIEVEGLNTPVTFVHVPDVHLGHQRGASYLQKILTVVQKEKPDFILYNGDLFDSNAGLTPEVFSMLSKVNTPQYFTSGNHEFYMDTERAIQGLTKAGVHVLINKVVDIGGVQFVGLEYMNADRESHDPHSVNSLYMNDELPKIAVDKNRPVLVAHHSPVGLDYVSEYGADVYVSGHTHAGQVWPATLLVGLNFPHYKGVKNHNGTKVIVSQGAGTFGPWMRLGSKNEVQLITLK